MSTFKDTYGTQHLQGTRPAVGGDTASSAGRYATYLQADSFTFPKDFLMLP